MSVISGSEEKEVLLLCLLLGDLRKKRFCYY